MNRKHGLISTILVLATLVALQASPVLAASSMTMCNAITNANIVSLKVKGGTVSGFKTIPPLKCLTVTVKTGDNKCSAWVYARVASSAVTGLPAATGLINTCGGKYMVNLRGQNTSSSLNITPIK